MNILQIEKCGARNLYEILCYITDVEGHENDKTEVPIPFVIGFGVNPNSAFEDMKAVQNFYNDDGGREFTHIEVSIENATLYEKVYDAFFAVGDVFYKSFGCQLLLAVHANKLYKNGCIHCHYVLNSVSFETGCRISFGLMDLYRLTDMINETLKKFCIPPVNTTRDKLRNNFQ